MRDREHIEAKALMKWALLSESKWPELRWLHHIPNGGQRGRAAAGKLNAEGVKKGVSDYFLPCARGGFHGLYVELKAQGGRLTPEQREFLAAMTAQGYRAEAAVGWLAAAAVIAEYLESGE